MFGIYVLIPMEENPDTIKLSHLSGVPHCFVSKLQAEIYLEQYQENIRKNLSIYDSNQASLILYFSHVMEFTATDIFDWFFIWNNHRLFSSLDKELLMSNLFYTKENWEAYTTIYSRNIYFKNNN